MPQPSIAPVVAGAPAAPTSARLDRLQDPCDPANPDAACEWFRVAWQEANPANVTVRVYAVTSCLHQPTASKPNANCLVDGDVIPRASLVLLGSVPASSHTFSFALDEAETASFGFLGRDGPEVDAVVIQAVNATGGSLFSIAGTSGSCYGCTL